MLLRYGDTDEHVQLSEAEIDEEFGKQDIARVFIKRGDLTEADVERGVTEMWIVETTGTADADADFGGVLRDISQNGSLTEFIVESFERYARDSLPTPGGERWDGVDDSTIIDDAVSSVSNIGAGTINTVKSPMTMVFSHASQAKKIRETEAAGSGEVKYRPDRTVDYVASIGADKTATTLSPSNQNIVGEFNAERKGGQEDFTHLRLVGAGEGRAQQRVNFIPNDDGDTYPSLSNVNRYAASHFASGDRKEWEVRSNKDHTDIDALTRLSETIVEDIQNTHIEATANLRGLDVNLGDEFTVSYPEENINQTARVVKMTTMIDSGGFVYQVTLSSRQQSLEDADAEERKDTGRYNLAFEGSPVTMTAGGGRQPVNNANNYQFSFYYPDEVKFEHRVNLFFRGLNYRAYSSGALSGGEHTHSVEITHPAHAHDISSTEFQHTHSLSSSLVSADSHGHTEGTFDADLHGHTEGTFDADPHGHTEGSFDADSHDHSVQIGDTSNQNDYSASYTTNDSTMADESGDSTPDYEGFSGISTSSDVWMTVQGEVASTSNDPVAISGVLYDGFSSGTQIDTANDTKESGGTYQLSLAAGNLDRTDDDVTVEVELTDQNFNNVSHFNVTARLIAIPQHSHDVFISGFSGSTGPAVNGQSDDTGPAVNGQSADTGPGVTGTSGNTGPGVSGDSDATGGIRTSTTELGTTNTTTTPTNEGGHEHEPEPGLIEFSEFPSNCDIIVNGTSVGTSFGDGAGAFNARQDIKGLLTPGQINTIEITSDTLGHIQANLDIDVYRQILGDG